MLNYFHLKLLKLPHYKLQSQLCYKFRFMLAIFRDCLCALLMNWSHLNSKCKSSEIIGILWMNTSTIQPTPVRKFTSMTCGRNCLKNATLKKKLIAFLVWSHLLHYNPSLPQFNNDKFRIYVWKSFSKLHNILQIK